MLVLGADLLTPHIIGKEFAHQIQSRIGGAMPKVTAELAEVADTFGPVWSIVVKWGGYTAHLSPARSVLGLSLDKYSEHFVQPVVEEWLRQRQVAK